jgi:hypothetical protein
VELAKLRETHSDISRRQIGTDQIVLTPPQRTDPRDHDRARVTNARRAAEELFRPKPQAPREAAPNALSPVEQSPRAPRILAISPAAPIRDAAVETPVIPKQPAMPEIIPASQLARIRTWVKYGMTVSQVAQLYQVTVEEIERILRKA